MQTPILSGLLAASFLLAGLCVCGEEPFPAAPARDSIEQELLDLCNQWLDDYSKGRVDRVGALFAPGAIVAIDAADSDAQRIMSAADFMALVRKSLKEGKTFHEWLTGEPTVLVDHKIATVWAHYAVESPGRRATGIDVFQFVHIDGTWKIVSLSYTNRESVAEDGTPTAGGRDSNPAELGRVEWSRDLDASIKRAAATGKPVLLLFQEIPG